MRVAAGLRAEHLIQPMPSPTFGGGTGRCPSISTTAETLVPSTTDKSQAMRSRVGPKGMSRKGHADSPIRLTSLSSLPKEKPDVREVH